MAATVELVQKQVKETFRFLTAKNIGTIPRLHGKLVEWTRQMPCSEKEAARKQSDVFLAMLEGDLRRAMWIVQESNEEKYVYLAADYVKNMASIIGCMKPQYLLGGAYNSDEVLKSEKMDGHALRSIIEMLDGSKDDSYLLTLARSCGVLYPNLRTIASFWSDVSPFEAGLGLYATELPMGMFAWNSGADDWKIDFDGRHGEFGLSVKNYEITYLNGTETGVSVFGQKNAGVHLKVGDCEVWQFQVKNEKLDELMQLLDGRAPVVTPLQLGDAEGTASVTVFDIRIGLNGVYARHPFYNVLKARVFDDPDVNLKEFEAEYAISRGVSPNEANSLHGRVSLWSCCDGASFRIFTEEMMH